MGSAFGKVEKFTINPEKEGQDECAYEMFRLLGLTDNDIDQLFTVFSKIDADGSGNIKRMELFAFFQVEATAFENGIFSIFDEDNSGMINFMEFICSAWNFLTLLREDMGSFAYLIRDSSAERSISLSDVKDIIEMLHKRKIEKDPSLATLFGSLAKICPDGDVEMSVFTKWAKANLSFSSPLMILQLHLRTNIVGTSFWARQSLRRQKDPSLAKVGFIKQLEKYVLDKNRQFKERLQAEEDERKRMIRLGMGKKGDSRDNVIRKQSILLGFFNLKEKDRESKYRSVDLKNTMPDALDKKDDDADDDQDAAFLHFASNNAPAKNMSDSKRQFNRSKHRPSLYNLLTKGSLTDGPKPAVPSRPPAPRKRGRSFYEALTTKAGKNPSGSGSSGKPTLSTVNEKSTSSKAGHSKGGKGKPHSKRKKSIFAAMMGGSSQVEPGGDDID